MRRLRYGDLFADAPSPIIDMAAEEFNGRIARHRLRTGGRLSACVIRH